MTTNERTREELRTSEIRYRRLFETARDGILILNAVTLKITDVNPFMMELLGYGRDEFLGKELWEIGFFEDKEASKAAYDQLQETGYLRYDDLPLKTNKGVVREVEFVSNVYNEDGVPVIQCNIRDITERKQAEEAVHISEARYRFLFENNPLSMWIFDLETLQFLAVNEMAIVHYGYSREEFLSMTVKDIRPPEEIPALLEAVSVQGRKLKVAGVWKHRKKDGSVIDVEITSHELNFENRPSRLVLANDVTERNRAETMLRQSEEHLQTVIEHLAEGLVVADQNSNVSYFNRAALAMHGFTTLEECRRHFDDFAEIFELSSLDGGIMPTDQWPLARVMRGENLRNFEVRIKRLDKGWEKVFDYGGVLIPATDDRPLMAIVTMSDITERKRAEILVLESEARVRAIVDTALDGIIVMDHDGHIVAFNPAAELIFGYRSDEVLGREMAELLIPPSQRDAHRQGLAHYRATGDGPILGKRIEVIAIRSDGTEFSVELAIQRIGAMEPPIFTGIVRDISELKQAGAIRESFAAIVEHSDDAIISKNLDGVITSWNSAAKKMFGYLPEEIIGQSVLRLIPPDRIDEEPRILARIIRGEITDHFETVRIAKDGTPIDVSVTISPIRDMGGKIAGASKILRDITESKRADEKIKRLNAELEQRVMERTAELEAVNKELEAFSYSVSHDLRAPLRHINGFSLALLEDYGEVLDATGKGYLREVRGASQEMAQLIDDVLQLARVTRSEMHREKTDLSEMATDIFAELRRREPERVVNVSVESGLAVYGDRRLLRIVLTNLLGNAWKFTEKSGNAEILFGGEEENGNTSVFVRDNGAGFNMAYADKLYRAFQRLHGADEFEGTGIGLATVQRIINRHGGRVWAEGAVNKGATFHFMLPELKEFKDEE